MPYILLAAAMAGFGSGYLTAWKIGQADILRLEMAIDKGNAQAVILLSTVRTQVTTAEAKAQITNSELDSAQRDYIKTVNALDAQLDNYDLAERLRESSRAACYQNTLPKGANPPIPEAETGFTRFSTELAELVRQKIRECEIVASYAQGAYEFVNSGAGCGIAH